jgi:hypothetical protein
MRTWPYPEVWQALDWQVRVYLLLVVYAPPWVRRVIPIAWRRRQLGKIAQLEFEDLMQMQERS